MKVLQKSVITPLKKWVEKNKQTMVKGLQVFALAKVRQATIIPPEKAFAGSMFLTALVCLSFCLSVVYPRRRDWTCLLRALQQACTAAANQSILCRDHEGWCAWSYLFTSISWRSVHWQALSSGSPPLLLSQGAIL